MQKIKTLITLFVISMSTGCSASSEQPEILNVYFFAHSELDTTDLRGRYLHLNDPLTEYKVLSSWNMAESATSPSKMDVIVLLSHGFSQGEKIQVNAEFYERVGPLILNEALGVTDVDEGLSKAQWSYKPILMKSIFYTSVLGVQQLTLPIKNIPIRGLAMERWNEKKWVYSLKAKVWLECNNCDKSKSFEKVIELSPGD